jgi:ubiquinone/menaquinone biosynthesis C-methylase UbiE
MQNAKETLESNLAHVDREFADIVQKLPVWDYEDLPSHWLHLEVLERFKVLSHARIEEGMTVLEVGSGAHALATVPLAHLVGDRGRVVAVERERWQFFDEILNSTGLRSRVHALKCDATRLPIPSERFYLGVLVHGVRSLRSRETIVAVFREMLRAAPRLFVAESLPIGKTDAQRAHLAMYNLREEIFEAVLGRKDDIHYLPLAELTSLAEAAGGIVRAEEIEVDLPHFLAFIPREYVGRIKDDDRRRDLLRRWDAAYEMLERHGEDHPPVGLLDIIRDRA